MSDNVIPFGGITRHDTPVEEVTKWAGKAGLASVVVIGWDADGDMYFASSAADGGEVLWLLESAKKALLDVRP